MFPTCPLCGSNEDVMSLPTFVTCGGSIELADLLSLPQPPVASSEVARELRSPKPRGMLPGKMAMDYMERVARWVVVYHWWEESFVCTGMHYQRDGSSPPLGPRVLRKVEGEWHDEGPKWFAEQMDLMMP
jgi:hypothetical protein